MGHAAQPAGPVVVGQQRRGGAGVHLQLQGGHPGQGGDVLARRLFEIVLDGTGGGGELHAEADGACRGVNCQVFDEPAVHDVHSKVGVDNAGQRGQHLALLGQHRGGGGGGGGLRRVGRMGAVLE
jgi:hypothetical protein